MKKTVFTLLVFVLISSVCFASSDIQAWRNAAKAGDVPTIEGYITAGLSPDVPKYLSAAL
ncbi:MAG: hypothetical protein ACD_62C00593G0001, partial [uncultured bacterium]